MEKEAFFSGYCRSIDTSRTVSVLAEDGALTQVDCCYETCLYTTSCPIAQSICAFLTD